MKGWRVTAHMRRLKKARRDKILFKNYVYTQYTSSMVDKAVNQSLDIRPESRAPPRAT